MNSRPPRYWFAARDSAWACRPLTWEGWAAYALTLSALFLALPYMRPAERPVFTLLATVAVLTPLGVLCYYRGEPQRSVTGRPRGHITSVPIASVEVDRTGRLAVRPDTRDTAVFEYIYRAATGVRWRPADQAFVPYEVKGATSATWFGIIVSSVRSELGLDLRLSPATKWIMVPTDQRQEIESAHGGVV
jgi:hypothetical protein